MYIQIEASATPADKYPFQIRSPFRDRRIPRLWKVSVNRHIKDFRAKADLDAIQLDGDKLTLQLKAKKPRFISILISSFTCKYAGTVKIKIDDQTVTREFRDVDAYHEATVWIVNPQP